LAAVRRYRNGRLAMNALSRRLKSRWRMIAIEDEWYDRERLRAELSRGLHVPQTRRALTQNELARIRNSFPWALAPR
jgi:hypothetical protein